MNLITLTFFNPKTKNENLRHTNELNIYVLKLSLIVMFLGILTIHTNMPSEQPGIMVLFPVPLSLLCSAWDIHEHLAMTGAAKYIYRVPWEHSQSLPEKEKEGAWNALQVCTG